MVENNQQNAPEKRPEKFGIRMRRALFWVVQYWRELFNFKFEIWNGLCTTRACTGCYVSAGRGIWSTAVVEMWCWRTPVSS